MRHVGRREDGGRPYQEHGRRCEGENESANVAGRPAGEPLVAEHTPDDDREVREPRQCLHHEIRPRWLRDQLGKEGRAKHPDHAPKQAGRGTDEVAPRTLADAEEYRDDVHCSLRDMEPTNLRDEHRRDGKHQDKERATKRDQRFWFGEVRTSDERTRLCGCIAI